MSSLISSTVASDTTQKLAYGLDAVQERIDRIVGAPITLRGWSTHDRDGNPRDKMGFPAQYQSMDDPPVAEKARVYEQMRGIYGEKLPEHPTVAMTFGDSDMEIWRNKEKMKQQVEFDSWLTDHYRPFTNPAEANWLQSIYPEYFEARVEENKALHELQAQWNTVQIQGPKSKEDLYLLYRVEKDPLLANRLSGTTGPQKTSGKDEYVRGFFNRARWDRTRVGEAKLDMSRVT